MSISGFTIVRNAGLLNYPFLESVRSVLPLCDEFIINCGDSTDNTVALCEMLVREHPHTVKLFFSTWNQKKQRGGFQLKYQTDLALDRCSGDWCFYVQADEAIHEDDYGLIRNAVVDGNRKPQVDGVLFEYLHFYGSFDYQIRGRNWYRKEVRLFKNHRNIKAFRDAQGFRKNDRRLLVIPSKARVFHYGYVRTPSSLRTKTHEMARWWGETPHNDVHGIQFKRHIGLARFDRNHPKVMEQRIRSFSFNFDPKQHRRKWTWDEFKNALALAWERFIPFRIGEFKNYRIASETA